VFDALVAIDTLAEVSKEGCLRKRVSVFQLEVVVSDGFQVHQDGGVGECALGVCTVVHRVSCSVVKCSAPPADW
jgi:hypothetical protein